MTHWSAPTKSNRLLIVAATGMEARALVDVEPVDAALAHGRWATVAVSESVSVAVCGIGRANAAGSTVQALALHGPFSTVINVGVCGALAGGGCVIGDVVVASDSVFAEEGIALPGGEVADMRGLKFGLYPSPGCEGNAMKIHERLVEELVGVAGQGAKVGRIATVARCSGSDEAARRVVEHTGALVEAMEGAAVVLAARRTGVERAGELRVVSNTCGDRDNQSWDLDRALGRLDEILAALAGR